MKKLLIASVFAICIPFAASAAELVFPSDAPVASITIPDSWGPKETETGVDATSEDGAIYFSIDVADASSADKTTDIAIDFLTKNGVQIDAQSMKETGETDVNGLKISALSYEGTDEEGPVEISLGFAAAGDKVLIFTYWGSKGTYETHQKELGDILASLKPAS
ncbi:histidine kinase [Rhizobium sp. G187]|uniref:histidine kinase n=1 Tax=Rhizobium sp. G187 TaxID=3451352 RepID=UPI003EE58704